MSKLRVLDLFSGIGGFSLGLERTGGFETVAFCEIEPFPRRVLAKHWPGTRCFDDVRKLTGGEVGPVDVICGGYPCQPFSTAGKRKGAQDDRHLWPEFMRLVAELRPAWVIGENVAGHISMGLDDVLADLEAEGYACRTFVIPACAVGASHRRDRVWTVAHAERDGSHEKQIGRSVGKGTKKRRMQQSERHCSAPAPLAHATCQQDRRRQQRGVEPDARAIRAGNVADTIGGGRPGPGQPFNASDQAAGGKGQADQFVDGRQRGKRGAESRMGGMADGFSCWLDEPGDRVKAGVKDRAPRLKALGNAVHPDIPMMIGCAILEAEAAA